MTARHDAAGAIVRSIARGGKVVARTDVLRALDDVPADVLAQLAVERGGLEVAGWAYSPYKRLKLQYHLCKEEPTAHVYRQPVYRITTPAAAGSPETGGEQA